jgi:hypothetical protein
MRRTWAAGRPETTATVQPAADSLRSAASVSAGTTAASGVGTIGASVPSRSRSRVRAASGLEAARRARRARRTGADAALFRKGRCRTRERSIADRP